MYPVTIVTVDDKTLQANTLLSNVAISRGSLSEAVGNAVAL